MASRSPSRRLTPAHRFADFVLDAGRRRLVAVREDHSLGATYPVNTLCAVGFDGAETVLVEGSDFYAAPRLSPDGRQLAWLCWELPHMPWEGTALWLADVAADGAIVNRRLIAGGADEAICQPEWSPGGVLHFVSDRSGWWNLYRYAADAVDALCERAAEFGVPQWNFGGSQYGFPLRRTDRLRVYRNGREPPGHRLYPRRQPDAAGNAVRRHPRRAESAATS